MKKKVTLYIDEAVWRKFRADCIQHGVVASQVLEEQARRYFEAVSHVSNDSQKDSHEVIAPKKKR